MSDADAFIADLDAEIEARGQVIRLQRLTTGPEGQAYPFEVKIMANVRAAAPTDLVAPGSKETVIVISPTALHAKRFPGLPRRDDRVIINGDPANVETVAPIYIGETLVRVKMTAKG